MEKFDLVCEYQPTIGRFVCDKESFKEVVLDSINRYITKPMKDKAIFYVNDILYVVKDGTLRIYQNVFDLTYRDYCTVITITLDNHAAIVDEDDAGDKYIRHYRSILRGDIRDLIINTCIEFNYFQLTMKWD